MAEQKNFSNTIFSPYTSMVSKRDIEAQKNAQAAENANDFIQKPADPDPELEKVKSEQVTFLCTKSVMAQINCLLKLYILDDKKIDGKKPTINKIINLAVSEYLERHEQDIERYKRITDAK